MNVRETGIQKCKFCKQVLKDPNEIEMNYHSSRYESFQSNEFTNEHKEIIELFIIIIPE